MNPRRSYASWPGRRRNGPSWPRPFSLWPPTRPARQRVLDNAHTGGAALWLVAPTRDRANHLVTLLADYSYSSLRYYGKDGVADIQQDAD
jgi:hypothetical protein